MMMILSFSIFSYIQSMQVYGETKRLREGLVSSSANRPHSYSPELIPFLPSQSKELKEYVSLSCHLVPQDIKNCIAAKFVHIYLEKHGINQIKSDPLLVLKLLCRAQSSDILLLGNKSFGWKDLILLKKEQQEDLVRLCNPNPYYSACVGTSNTLLCEYGLTLKACGCSSQESDLDTLKSMPIHIKKGLIVNVIDNSGCALCGFLVMPGSLLTGPMICCAHGFTWATCVGTSISGVIAMGIYIWERARQRYYRKSYFADLDSMQR